MHRTTTPLRLVPLFAALVVSAALALACSLATATPAYADDETSIAFSGIPYNGDYGIYGTPGEKMTIIATAMNGYYYDGTKIKGATYKWNCNKKLKAKVKGDKITIKKLPKAGKYKIKVTAYNKKGKKLCTRTQKIIVKAKPSLKVAVRIFDGKKMAKLSTVKKGDNVQIAMNGAWFGWDNNKKKPFYTWTVKSLSTGKTATWNTKHGSFNSNSFIEGSSAAGSGGPICFGTFSKTGKYTITATVYHSDKVIATSSKTITVK